MGNTFIPVSTTSQQWEKGQQNPLGVFIWGSFIGFTVSCSLFWVFHGTEKLKAESREGRLWFSTTEMNGGFCSTGNLLSFLLLVWISVSGPPWLSGTLCRVQNVDFFFFSFIKAKTVFEDRQSCVHCRFVVNSAPNLEVVDVCSHEDVGKLQHWSGKDTQNPGFVLAGRNL